MKDTHDIYGGLDPRDVPAYAIQEAAQYLAMPVATLRDWTRGRSHPSRTGRHGFATVITLADAAEHRLSFYNLVEAHVLCALRRNHRLSLQNIRKALRFVLKSAPSAHPLADYSFATDGLSLFLEAYGRLINVSRQGQLELRDLIQRYLERVERDESRLASRLFPFTRPTVVESPRVVVIDPRIAFGRPVLVGTSIPTKVIAERFRAGETIPSLAGDYGRSTDEIEEALRCELETAA